MKKAACLFINPLTALGFIEIAKQKELNSILHTSASSAVGRILIKLCKTKNINLISTVKE